MNGKIYKNVTHASQGELNLYKGQNTGVVDLRSGYFHITRDSIQRCSYEIHSSQRRITRLHLIYTYR